MENIEGRVALIERELLLKPTTHHSVGGGVRRTHTLHQLIHLNVIVCVRQSVHKPLHIRVGQVLILIAVRNLTLAGGLLLGTANHHTHIGVIPLNVAEGLGLIRTIAFGLLAEGLAHDNLTLLVINPNVRFQL